jgi:Flp pilus assembly pilin Flp
MLNFIKTFRADEDGAVTVDWVVLTAAVVGLGIAIGGSIDSSATALANDIAADVNDQITN